MTPNQAARDLLGVASFNPDTYEELRNNPDATVPAIAVVVIATMLMGLATTFGALLRLTAGAYLVNTIAKSGGMGGRAVYLLDAGSRVVWWSLARSRGTASPR